MKRIVTSVIIGTILVSATSAQPVLTYDHHALMANIDNPMSYCNYKDPGIAGADIIWDFSDLIFDRSFTGYLKDPKLTRLGISFPKSNTELAEFDSRFFLQVDNDKMEQFGYSSSDGRIQIRYDVPFVKMKFPFAYDDFYSGTFSGKTYVSGIENGTVIGTYSVEADAYGTLILPGSVTYENTLRIRTEKRYTSIISRQQQEVNIITYRWYNELHRYPILVLTEYSVKSGDNTTVNHQAAYNSNAVRFLSPILTESVLLYPNPATSYLGLELDAVAAGTITFTISDISGKIVSTFSEEISMGGKLVYNLSDKIAGLSPASYYLTIRSGEGTVRRSFTLVE